MDIAIDGYDSLNTNNSLYLEAKRDDGENSNEMIRTEGDDRQARTKELEGSNSKVQLMVGDNNGTTIKLP